MLPNKKGSLPRATADVYRTIEVDMKSAMKKTAKKPWTTVHHKERKDYP